MSDGDLALLTNAVSSCGLDMSPGFAFFAIVDVAVELDGAGDLDGAPAALTFKGRAGDEGGGMVVLSRRNQRRRRDRTLRGSPTIGVARGISIIGLCLLTSLLLPHFLTLIISLLLSYRLRLHFARVTARRRIRITTTYQSAKSGIRFSWARAGLSGPLPRKHDAARHG